MLRLVMGAFYSSEEEEEEEEEEENGEPQRHDGGRRRKSEDAADIDKELETIGKNMGDGKQTTGEIELRQAFDRCLSCVFPPNSL